MLTRIKEAKTLTKCILAASAVLILLLGSYAVLRFGFGMDLFNRGGWSEAGGVVRYLDARGKPLVQWQTIGGKRYYFAPLNGHMMTGWCKIGNDRYYFDENGVCAAGLQTVDGKTYGFAPDGKCLTGWQEVDGVRYCFAFDGSMYTGWQTVDGQRYYFTAKGKTLSGWQELDGERYYFTPEGHTLSGLQMLDGKHYLFHAGGYALTGWQEVDGARYRFDLSGSALQGWFEDKNGTYFFAEDGRAQTGWQELSGKRYYFAEDGTMTTGWLTQGEDRYYFHANGAMAVGEVKVDGVSQFFAANGKYILLVNAWNPVPADFQLDLVNYGSYKIDRSARDGLEAMLKACREAGYSCSVNNIYRSKDLQQYLWNRTMNQHMANGMTYEQAYIETGKDTAFPGHSEHQTGLAVDFDGKKSYEWLKEHCWEYGFIVRYPESCYEHTGIIYEPWHLRYVGTEFALELRQSGLCMEEYMEKLTNG